MSDDRVLYLAEKLISLSEFVNQWWMRALLVIAGMAIVFSASPADWRIRQWFALRLVALAFRICPHIQEPVRKGIERRNERDAAIANLLE